MPGIKHWRTSLGGLRRKQEHVADLNTQSKVSINFLSKINNIKLSSFKANIFPDKFRAIRL